MSTEYQSSETQTEINSANDNESVGDESVQDINKTRLLLTL